MPQSHGYSSGTFAVEIEGKTAGFVRSVQGGEAFGTVIATTPGPDGIAKKHIGSVNFEPITITFGVGMAPEVYGWMAEMLERRQTPRNGAICFLSYDFTEVERLEWTNGLITEIGFPAADGGSKEVALISMTIAPESMTLKPSNGQRHSGFSTKGKKQWLASNFRFSVTGLEKASANVRRVSALKVTQPVTIDDGGGAERIPTRQLGTVAISDLLVTVGLSSAQPWFDWVDDFLIKGNSGDQAERTGTLEFLDHSAKDVLFSLTVDHVGPVRARRQLDAAKAAVMAEVEVELYCESATMTLGSNTSGAVVNPQPPVEERSGTESEPVASPPPSGGSGAAPAAEGESVEVERALRVLRSASPTRKPELIAARLRATTARITAAAAPQRAQRTDGESLGERWASEQASLLELQELEALDGADWSGIRLSEDHTLVAQLRTLGVIPPGGEGPLQLVRDDFVEGVVTGAARVLRAAKTHLAD